MAVLGATTAGAQAVSEWTATEGVPVAIVEVAGGDVEHFAVLLPQPAPAALRLNAVRTTLRPGLGGYLWQATVPALLGARFAADIAAALPAGGATAFVAVGAVPARELAPALAALDSVPDRPLPRVPCWLAEGGIEVRRGAADGVELELAAPSPEDPRFDLLPVLTGWLKQRLETSFSAVDITVDLGSGCPQLRVRVDPGHEEPRSALRHLRQILAELAATRPTADEATRAQAAAEVLSAAPAVDGARVAAELARRLALGARAAPAVNAPFVDATTLGDLARQVLAAHAGFAVVTEAERRPAPQAPVTLENGAILTVGWVPGDTAVIAAALGGFDTAAGAERLGGVAQALSSHGWWATVNSFPGVPTVAVAVPRPEVAGALEQLVQSLAGSHAPVIDELEGDAAASLGLHERITADTVSVALSLPADTELGTEAARKFLADLPTTEVRAGATLATPGLNWSVREGEPRELALVELPISVAGLVAARLLAIRLAAVPATSVRALAPPGHLFLEVRCDGGAHVPALDGRLGAAWAAARRTATVAETEAARQDVEATFFGDLARATARAAAAPFLPIVPDAPALLAVTAVDVNRALAGLPAWDSLVRFARGVAPQVVLPPSAGGGVRKSRPRTSGGKE
jgi:hypothetical protein